MTRGRSRFISNTAALTVSLVVTTALTLAQVKILAGHLPQDAFGLFSSLRGLSLFVSILAANGLPQLLVRFLPAHEAHQRRARAMMLSVVCVVTTTLLFFAGAVLITKYPSILPAYHGHAFESSFRFWFFATTLGVALKLVLYAGLNGLRRINIQSVLEMMSLAVQVGWIWSTRDALDMTSLFRILGVVSLGTLVVGLPWYFAGLLRDVHPGDGGTATADEGYGRYWVGAAGLSVVALAFSDVDRYLLSHLLALEMLSLFHIASRIARLSNRLLSVPVLAFQPEVTRLDAEGRADQVASSTRVFLKFNVAVSILFAGGVAVYAPEIIRAVANAGYLGARPVLLLMVASVPMTAMTAPLTTVMKARDQIGHAFFCDLAWALTYIGTLFVFGRAYGIIGTGIAQVTACAVQLGFAIALGRLGIALRSLAAMALRAATAALFAFVPLVLLAHYWTLTGTTALALKVVLIVPALIVFRAVAAWLDLFDSRERDRLVRMFEAKGLGVVARRVLP